ncbi:MAG TPA: ATP-binding protein, partial [Lacipirellula sp.]
MTDVELQQLMIDLESDRTERKESIADRDRIREAICALANDMPGHDKPGVIFIGVRDDGTCANVDVDDQLLLTLAAMRSDGNILPIPSMEVQKKALGGCEIAVIIVHPSNFPPVRFKGRIHIRVGPRRAIASQDEERRLNERRLAGDLPFDLRPIIAA